MVSLRFAQPEALLLLLPMVLGLMLWWRGRLARTPAVLRYSDTRLLAGLPVNWRLRWRWLPNALRLLAWVCLVVALARPQGGQANEILQGRGIDMVVLLDISGSMSIRDYSPLNRLEAAKEVIARFIDGREFDRIGLVVFAESAIYQAPPTLDYGMLQRILANVTLAQASNIGDRTAIGVGLGSALNMLRRSDGASQVIILVTDGANNAGIIDPMTAARAARALGVRVYTIGIGTSDGSDFDETTLREIASMTGGRYYHARTLDAMQNVYREIDRLEQGEFDRRLTIRWQEWAWGWLVAGLFLLVSERVLRQTVFQTIP